MNNYGMTFCLHIVPVKIQGKLMNTHTLPSRPSLGHIGGRGAQEIDSGTIFGGQGTQQLLIH